MGVVQKNKEEFTSKENVHSSSTSKEKKKILVNSISMFLNLT